ncbi:MAG: hypothetical protein M3Z11_00900, partial [Candidatus Dormibacteraeota bacterium]|nr:hypothetical protein [Candidatus Dormibacteraeota bacterium]
MKPSPRSAIRNDVLADYEAPAPDLAPRVLRAIADVSVARAPRGRAVVFQTMGVVMAALLIGVATIGLRVSRGEMALPAGTPFGLGGLHPPAASYFIADAQFVSANTAWILAQLHEHNGPTVLMNTTDGGNSWHEQFRIPDGSAIGSLRFWNSTDGQLVEMVPSTLPPSKIPGAPGSSNMVSRTYRTHDGGAHWQLLDLPVDWSAAGAQDYFLTQALGWRLLPSLSVSGPGDGSLATVQQTTDGGSHWRTVGILPPGAWLGALNFTDSQTGWIAASGSKRYAWDAKGNPIPYTPPAALLYVTRDGGRTWGPVSVPLPQEAAANNVRLESPILFGSRNGALEFEVTGPPPSGVPEAQQQASAGQGWTHSYIVTTNDGGVHWSSPMRTPGGLQEGGAFFFDARHWLTSSGSDLHETFDAGKTWSTRQVLASG